MDRTNFQYPAHIALPGKRLQKSSLLVRRHVRSIPTARLAKVENTIAFLEITGMQIMHCPHAIASYPGDLFRKKTVPRT